MSDAPPVHALFHVVETTDDERLLRLGWHVLAAASVGRSSTVLLCAASLRKRFNGPAITPPAGLPDPWSALDEASQLAPVTVCTCDTERALSGLPDDVLGALPTWSLPALWRAASSADVLVW